MNARLADFNQAVIEMLETGELQNEEVDSKTLLYTPLTPDKEKRFVEIVATIKRADKDSPPGGGESGVARGGVISARRLHRQQPEMVNEARRPLLQPRGTAEQWIKEGKNAVEWTKLSCRRFKDNEARLQLPVPRVEVVGLPNRVR